MAKTKKLLRRAAPLLTFTTAANAWVYVNRRLHGSRKPALTFHAPVNVYTGFGQMVQGFVENFAKDYKVCLKPSATETTHAKLPKSYAKFLKVKDEAKWELRVGSADCHMPITRPFVLFTMWESTKLRPEWVTHYNEAMAICVPCDWNADIFSAAGVRVPIKVVPLGVSPRQFPYTPMQMRGPCVFGTGGRLSVGGSRKGLAETARAFIEAFPLARYPDVRLRVKCFSDCPLDVPADPRIDVIRSYMTTSQLAAWYSSLTAYVSCCTAGGWELMPHQALLSGRPVIACNYGGLGMYFDTRYCYRVDHSLVPTDGFYVGLGHWARPDKESLHKAMRSVYSDRKTAQLMGRAGAKAMLRFTDADSAASLKEALASIGLI